MRFWVPYSTLRDTVWHPPDSPCDGEHLRLAHVLGGQQQLAPKCSSMARAVPRPSAMAQTISDAPRRMSPAAKRPIGEWAYIFRGD